MNNLSSKFAGAGVAWLCNGLPRSGPGFDSWWERCKNRASRPSQGTVNGGAISKWPRCRCDVKHNQPTNIPTKICRIIVYYYQLYNITDEIALKLSFVIWESNCLIVLFNIKITSLNYWTTVEPLLWGHPFCIRKVAIQEGWPLIRGRNQNIYV